MDSKLLRKWLDWFEVIEKDIQQLLIHRNIFWEVQKIIKNNENIQKPSSFYHYLGQTYIAYITVGIRRQIKISKQSISISRLLTEIIENPSILSRDYFNSLYKDSIVEDRADRDFDKFTRENPNCVSTSMVRNDLCSLKLVVKKIETFADKKIAHHDIKPPKSLPLFSDVDECLEELDQLAVKYILLLRGHAQSTLMPIYQYDWTDIFRVAWLPPDGERHISL